MSPRRPWLRSCDRLQRTRILPRPRARDHVGRKGVPVVYDSVGKATFEGLASSACGRARRDGVLRRKPPAIPDPMPPRPTGPRSARSISPIPASRTSPSREDELDNRGERPVRDGSAAARSRSRSASPIRCTTRRRRTRDIEARKDHRPRSCWWCERSFDRRVGKGAHLGAVPHRTHAVTVDGGARRRKERRFAHPTGSDATIPSNRQRPRRPDLLPRLHLDQDLRKPFFLRIAFSFSGSIRRFPDFLVDRARLVDFRGSHRKRAMAAPGAAAPPRAAAALRK